MLNQKYCILLHRQFEFPHEWVECPLPNPTPLNQGSWQHQEKMLNQLGLQHHLLSESLSHNAPDQITQSLSKRGFPGIVITAADLEREQLMVEEIIALLLYP